MTALEDLRRDVRYGVRSLAATPSFTLVALATLAAGIGATTLIFSIVSGVLLRPLPFPDPDRLVEVNETTPAFGVGAVVFANLQEYRREAGSFEGFAAYSPTSRNLEDAAGPVPTVTIAGERNLFGVVGVEPVAGRTFRDDDPLEVAVISTAFALRRFGAAAAALGRTLTLDAVPYTIVGVMPDTFQFPYVAARLPGAAPGSRIDVWVPWQLPGGMESNRRLRMDFVVARMKPGVSMAAAQSELVTIVGRIAAAFPETDAGRGVLLRPMREVVTGDVGPSLLALMGAVGLVLLVSCANVANLLLVRATTRAREMAVRAALGAGRMRLVRQLFTESLVLSFAGAALGLAIAAWGAPVVLSIAADKIPRAWEIGIDWRVFMFAAAVSAAAGVAFGLAPALEAARRDVSATLRGGAAAGANPERRRLRDALAIAEVALAFMLLVGAGLLVREFVRLQQTDTGMAAERVLTAHLSPALTPAEYQRLVERVSTLPGVRAAAFAQMLPLQNWGWTGGFAVRGRPAAAPAEQPTAELRYVTPEYFRTLGIPIKRGRTFTAADTAGATRVIMVNEALARRYFGDDDPVGQITDRGLIIGIAGDVRQTGVDREPFPEIYYPMAQNVSQRRELGMSLIVSADVAPATLAAPIRAVVHEAHPHVAVFNVKTLNGIVAESMADHRLNAWLLGLFAAVAVALACAGIYGVVSYAATARTREFGIRMALGADSGRVLRMVARQGAVLTLAGLAAGLTGAFALARFLGSVMPGAGSVDLRTTGAAAVLMGAVAIAATLVPALRAARVDPVIAVRLE